MKQLITTLFIIAATYPSISRASDSIVQAINHDEAAVIALSKGQASPFSGVLFNTAATASVIVEYNTAAENTNIQVRKAVADTESQKNKLIEDIKAQCRRETIELNASVASLDDILSLKQKENNQLKEQIADSPNRFTWLGIGVIGGIVFTLATVFATSSLTK